MSMYNLLFGRNHFAEVLLTILGITLADVPRFRDCYLDENNNIVIYTRTGGGNREDYEKENDFLTTVKGYLGDEDDDFDCTYAYFTYKPPKGSESIIAEIKELGGSDNPNRKWTDTLEKMQSHNPDQPTKEMLKRITPLMNKIFSAVKDDKSDKVIKV